MTFKTLSKKYITKHQYFTSTEDAYQTPTGKIVEPYFVVELAESATAVAITIDNHIILVEQYRHPIGQVCYELPGGFIDTNEPKETAMARELLEETGHSFNTFIYLGKTYANPGILNNATHLFLATGGTLTSTQHLDENEEINIHFKTIEDVKTMLLKNEILQSMHEVCLNRAFNYIENKK